MTCVQSYGKQELTYMGIDIELSAALFLENIICMVLYCILHTSLSCFTEVAVKDGFA